ncbi:MAG: carbohydrate ABC transporter permease, partial [Thermotogaceae bacterium]|nr:carbohydrate ABC transporter permease [Thermotogaceae bacterium]
MRKKPHIALRTIVVLMVLFVAIVINLPFIWMLVTSFKTEDAAFTIPPSFLPTIFDFR